MVVPGTSFFAWSCFYPALLVESIDAALKGCCQLRSRVDSEMLV